MLLRPIHLLPVALLLGLLPARHAAAQPGSPLTDLADEPDTLDTHYGSTPGWYAGLSAGFGPYGVKVGRTFLMPSGYFSVQASVLVGRLWDERFSYALGQNAGLFVPVQLRTGGPATRVHALLGGGAVWWIKGREATRQAYGTRAAPPLIAMLAPGVEARLLPLSRYEITLSAMYYVQLTPAGARGIRPLGSPPYTNANELAGKWSIALNVYLR